MENGQESLVSLDIGEQHCSIVNHISFRLYSTNMYRVTKQQLEEKSEREECYRNVRLGQRTGKTPVALQTTPTSILPYPKS